MYYRMERALEFLRNNIGYNFVLKDYLIAPSYVDIVCLHEDQYKVFRVHDNEKTLLLEQRFKGENVR